MASSTAFMNNDNSKNVSVFSAKFRKISKEFIAYIFFKRVTRFNTNTNANTTAVCVCVLYVTKC